MEESGLNVPASVLEIRFRGPAVERGRLPVAHLASFLDSWRKIVQRTGRVLRGEARSVRRGQPPQDLKSELEFELVSFAGNGNAAVLGLERRLENASFPEMDFGLKVLLSAAGGLKQIESEGLGDALPAGMDAGVLRAWRDAGVLLGQGIDTIRFAVNHPSGAVSAALTAVLLERIRERLTVARINIRKIEGRLLMVDFTSDQTRCRIHPDDGEPIFCLVDEKHKDAVIANMLRDVVITSEVENDPVSGEITAIRLRDIEPRPAPPEPTPEKSPEPVSHPALLDNLDPAE